MSVAAQARFGAAGELSLPPPSVIDTIASFSFLSRSSLGNVCVRWTESTHTAHERSPSFPLALRLFSGRLFWVYRGSGARGDVKRKKND